MDGVKAAFIMYTTGGGGADDFEGGSRFFWKGTRGDVEIFYNRKGGCQFFYLILVYNEKATVIIFFF